MYRILVADDESIERKVVRKRIEKNFMNQLEVVDAVNGREAVELFERENCHIALLDIEMPGINGLAAAERIREQHKKICIIFLTAFDEFSYAKRAISVGALDYLLKPGTEEELVMVLEEAIRRTDEQLEAPENTAEQPDEAAGEADEAFAENIRVNAVTDYIRGYIEKHYMDDISLQEIASSLNYSDAYFCKLFTQCFDKSFVVYLSEYRVGQSKALLADVSINIKDISLKVGYRDSNYFAKVFKRMVGMTPSDYRLMILRQK